MGLLALPGCKGLDLFAEGGAPKALAAIKEKLGGERELYGVEAYRDQLRMRVRDDKDPSAVKLFWYDGKGTHGPNKVSLMGSGSIEPGLFAWSDCKLELLADMVKEAEKRSKKKVHKAELAYTIVRDDKTPLDWDLELAGGGFAWASLDGEIKGVEKKG